MQHFSNNKNKHLNNLNSICSILTFSFATNFLFFFLLSSMFFVLNLFLVYICLLFYHYFLNLFFTLHPFKTLIGRGFSSLIDDHWGVFKKKPTNSLDWKKLMDIDLLYKYNCKHTHKYNFTYIQIFITKNIYVQIYLKCTFLAIS